MSNATIKVQFGIAKTADGRNPAHLSAQIDSRPTGGNGGRTRFSPGESVSILVFKSDNVNILQALCSAGSISANGSAQVEFTEEIMFEDTNESSLPVPCAGSISKTDWLGNGLGALTVQSDRVTVRAASKGVAVANVTFTANALIYKLTSPSKIGEATDFSVLAIIQGEQVS